MLCNVTYENHPFPQMYGKVPEALTIVLSKKKGFKAFVYKHNPTRIAMVTVEDNKLVIGSYNG